MNIILVYNLRKYIKSVFQHIMQNKIQEVFHLFKAILAGMSTNIKINVIWNWISHLEEKSIDSVIFTKCLIRF